MARLKNLYCGVFNYSRQVTILYAYAYSPVQAKEVFLRRLAKEHDVGVYWVRKLFDGEKNNFEITLETEFREE